MGSRVPTDGLPKAGQIINPTIADRPRGILDLGLGRRTREIKRFSWAKQGIPRTRISGMKSGERERERRKKRSFSGTEGEGEGIKALRGPIPLTARSLSHARIDLQGFLVPVSSIVGTRRVDGLLHGRLSSAAPCIGASRRKASWKFPR